MKALESISYVQKELAPKSQSEIITEMAKSIEAQQAENRARAGRN